MVRQGGYLRTNYRKVQSSCTVAVGFRGSNEIQRGWLMISAGGATASLFLCYTISGALGGAMDIMLMNVSGGSLSIADWPP